MRLSPRNTAFGLISGLASFFLFSCNFYSLQSDPYVDPAVPVPVIPYSVPPPGGFIQSKLFYNTATIQFKEPVWFGEYPGETGAFMVGELGGDLFLLEPIANGYQKVFFGHVPVVKFPFNDGLLGLAFHPDFKQNRKYYVYYNTGPRGGLLQERSATASFKNDAGTARNLLTIDTGGVDNSHNGGDAHFGKDGYLYLSLGDRSQPYDYVTNSEDLHVLYGKMIRIDVNRSDGSLQYGIPTDNPFVKTSDAMVRKEIYASGFRNPWRWSFDPLNGRIFGGDVGNVKREEVDQIEKGADYGWKTVEGDLCFDDSDYSDTTRQCDKTGLTPPIAVLPHDNVVGCVIGGAVFRGDATSPFYGDYVFGDYMTRELYILHAENGQSGLTKLGKAPANMSSFGTDSKGNIYVVGYYTGIIYRLEHPYLIGK